MIILEIIKAITEMFFWITFTCVLLCVLGIIRQKKLDVTEKIKKLNESQNQMRAQLEENQNLMEDELKGYIRNCSNAIEQLSKRLDTYRNKSENYVKKPLMNRGSLAIFISLQYIVETRKSPVQINMLETKL